MLSCLLVLASAAACRRACDAGPPLATDGPGDAGAAGSLPSLHVEPLGKARVRLELIALDGAHVYFSTLFGGARRVAKTGGEIELLDASGFPPAGARVDPRHAYFNGRYSEPTRALAPDGSSYEVDGNGVHRRSPDGGSTTLARAFRPNIERKVLLLDDERLYWLEPSASAVLSVPLRGGPVAYVCQAWVPVHYEMALAGDRIYLLDIDGTLESVPKAGGPLVYHGNLSSELAQNRNGVWMTADQGWLYVVSDADGSEGFGAVHIDLTKPLPPGTPDPTFDSRVVRVRVPETGAGTVLEPNVGGLVFGTNVWMSPEGAPADGDMKRMASELEPLGASLKTGKLPVTVSIGAADGAAPGVTARMEAIEARLRAELGAGVRVDRTVRAVAADAGARFIDVTAYVGIERKHVAEVFAP